MNHQKSWVQIFVADSPENLASQIQTWNERMGIRIVSASTTVNTAETHGGFARRCIATVIFESNHERERMLDLLEFIASRFP